VRVVVDTNVLFEGLSRLGPSGQVVDAWAAGRLQPCVSTALALEYEDVLARSFGPSRSETVHKALQALLVRCEYVPIRFTYRPASPDPGDDLVVDCVLNGRAVLVTHNLRDFRRPAAELGFRVMDPIELLALLEMEDPR
jgi:predicted nucleic acid-binding protein